MRAALDGSAATDVYAAAIDPALADTAAFCEHYGIGLEDGANCVIVEAKRGDSSWYAACLVLGHERIDVNSLVRKHLGAKKVSFAPMDAAVELTGMEYGGITPDRPARIVGAAHRRIGRRGTEADHRQRRAGLQDPDLRGVPGIAAGGRGDRPGQAAGGLSLRRRGPAARVADLVS